jgi:Na+/melibiose symporter-like transporter
MMVSAFAWIAIFYLCLRWLHWEKKSCYTLGLILFLPVAMDFYFIEREPISLIYLGGAGAGIGTATVFLLPAMMLPDTVDDAELRLAPGEHHHEGLFYSFFVFFTKLAAGLAILLSNLVLEGAGYITQTEPDVEPVQPESVGFALRVLMGPTPTACVVLAVVVLQWYPITEESRRRTWAELNRRHAAAKEK